MTIVFGLALYAMIWSSCCSRLLPFGVETQAEAGEVVPGTPESAPAKPRLGRVFLATSVIAAMVFRLVGGPSRTTGSASIPTRRPPQSPGSRSFLMETFASMKT